MSTVTEAKPEKFIVPAEEHPQVIALKQGYQAAFFPDGKIRENPYLNTGNVECAWAWLEGFHYGTHYVMLQNDNMRLQLEVANLKTMLPNLPAAQMQQTT